MRRNFLPSRGNVHYLRQHSPLCRSHKVKSHIWVHSSNIHLALTIAVPLTTFVLNRVWGTLLPICLDMNQTILRGLLLDLWVHVYLASRWRHIHKFMLCTCVYTLETPNMASVWTKDKHTLKQQAHWHFMTKMSKLNCWYQGEKHVFVLIQQCVSRPRPD